MGAAIIMIGAAAGQILKTLQSSGTVENQLRNASVQVFSLQPQKIGVFVKINGQFPAKYSACRFVFDLNGHLLCRNFATRLVHDTCLLFVKK